MRKSIIAAAVGGLLVLAGGPASAQSDTVTVVVSYPAGSPPDVVARIVTDKVASSLGRTFIVDNRPGGAGNVGTNVVAQAAPNGNTLLVSANGPVAVNQALFADLPYDPETDLAPISLLVSAPLVMIVNPNLPVNDVDEFVEYARENPGVLSYATTGVGSGVHLTMEVLKQQYDLDIVHIPYNGSAEAIADLMGGTIDVMFAIASGALPFVQEGNVRAIAITSAEPLELAPEIVTVHEQGYGELESSVWIGLLAPGETPDEIINQYYETVAEVLEDPEIQSTLANQGYQIVGSDPAEFRTFIGEETVKWAAVIEAAGISPE